MQKPVTPILPDLIRLAIPIMLANLLQMMYNLVDAWFLGKISAAAVSAPSIAFSVIFFLSVFGMGFSAAGTTLVAQARGSGRRDRSDFYAAQTLSLVTVVGIAAGTLGVLGTDPVLALLHVPPETLAYTRVYMRIVFAGTPFMYFYFVLQAVLQGVGDSITPLLVQLGTVTLNIILDAVLIFGLGPFPAMDVAGAATATVISRAVSAGIALVILARGRTGVRIRLKDLPLRLPAMRKFVAIGLPMAIGQGISAFGFTVLQGVVNGFGVAVVAAFGVGNRIIGLFNMPAIGLSRATASLVGQKLGAGQKDDAWSVVRLSLLAMLVFIVPGMAFTFFYGNTLVRFFVDDPLVVHHGATLFRIVSVSVIPFTLFNVINGAFQGGGLTRPMMYLGIIRLWGLRVPLAFLFAITLEFGPNGIWYAMFISNIVAAGVGFILLRQGKWLRQIA